MTDLAAVQRPGDHLARRWTVYTSWRAYRSVPVAETRTEFADWPTARHEALSLACLNGVRYVTVQGPDDVVHGEWDRYTNRWREYPPPLDLDGNPAA